MPRDLTRAARWRFALCAKGTEALWQTAQTGTRGRSPGRTSASRVARGRCRAPAAPRTRPRRPTQGAASPRQPERPPESQARARAPPDGAPPPGADGRAARDGRQTDRAPKNNNSAPPRLRPRPPPRLETPQLLGRAHVRRHLLQLQPDARVHHGAAGVGHFPEVAARRLRDRPAVPRGHAARLLLRVPRPPHERARDATQGHPRRVFAVGALEAESVGRQSVVDITEPAVVAFWGRRVQITIQRVGDAHLEKDLPQGGAIDAVLPNLPLLRAARGGPQNPRRSEAPGHERRGLPHAPDYCLADLHVFVLRGLLLLPRL